jgi:hypothetical protein
MADRKDVLMEDAIFLVLTVLFFVVSVAYVRFCERIR